MCILLIFLKIRPLYFHMHRNMCNLFILINKLAGVANFKGFTQNEIKFLQNLNYFESVVLNDNLDTSVVDINTEKR